MNKPISRLKSTKVSDPKVLIGLTVFLVLTGGMVIDPLAGFICFVMAGMLALIAGMKGTKQMRYIAFFLLIIIVVLMILKFSEASHHLRVYKSETVTSSIK